VKRSICTLDREVDGADSAVAWEARAMAAAREKVRTRLAMAGKAEMAGGISIQVEVVAVVALST
jgi:hypothetical protein